MRSFAPPSTWMQRTGTVLAAFILLWLGANAYSILSFPAESPPPEADAAIVLGAALLQDKPSPVFEERIRHGLRLYKDGKVQKLIFTGGRSSTDAVAESEAARSYAIENGIPPVDIRIETVSRITEENLSQALAIGLSEQWHTYVIVSDPLHMKRSMMIADYLGMRAFPSPTPTSAYRSWATKAPFFLREWFFDMAFQLSLPFRR